LKCQWGCDSPGALNLGSSIPKGLFDLAFGVHLERRGSTLEKIFVDDKIILGTQMILQSSYGKRNLGKHTMA
jgi:hypothetical protein